MSRRAFRGCATLLRAATVAPFRPASRTVGTDFKQLIQTTGVRACSSKMTARHSVVRPDMNSVHMLRAQKGKGYIDIDFNDGSSSAFPFVWLRDNCQCSSCYDADASSRKLLLENLNVQEYPSSVQNTSTDVYVTWSDEHKSKYNANWLHQHAFTATARSNYAQVHALTQVPWGAGYEFSRFSFEELVSDDKCLLEWLVTMEKTGMSLVTNMPEDFGLRQFLEHVAFIRRTHYGDEIHVEFRPIPNNLSFTSNKLGLHTDAPYYEYVPGMIFLQCVKQDDGMGGATHVSDGLFAAEYLRQYHPDAHRVLRTTPVYFKDKGTAGVPEESPRFYKINKSPILQYDDSDRLIAVRHSNQVRDSCMAIPAEDVQPFYSALRLFYDVMGANSISYKMKAGDMVVLDNRRCMHGRQEFEARSAREIVVGFLDLDEARCRRRELQDRMGAFNIE